MRVLLAALAACGSFTPPPPAAGVPANAAPAVAAPAPFRWLVAPARHPHFERAAVVGGELVAVEAGQVSRLAGDRWVPSAAAPPAVPPPALRIVAGAVVRVRDGARFRLPPDTVVQLAALGPDDLPIIVANGVWIWRVNRHTFTERRSGDAIGMFEEPLPPGFDPVRETLPDIIAIVTLGGAPLLVGREGDVTRLDGETAVKVVAVPRSRNLGIVPLPDRVVIVTEDGATVAYRDRTASIGFDAETRGALREVSERSHDLGVSWLVGAAGGPDRAVFGAGRDVLEIVGDRAIRRRLPETEEVIGLARDDQHGYVVLGHIGRVFAPSAHGLARLGSLADLPGPDGANAIGAYTGADGRARLVDRNRTLVCATATGLAACGPMIAISPAVTSEIDGGLVIEDQSIRTQLVTDGAVRELPDALPEAMRRAFAGPAAAPIALAHNTIVRFDGKAWQTLAQVPPEWPAQSLAVAGSTIYVGVRDGAVLALP